MFILSPTDMWDGLLFIILSPVWGILALIVTIPLEAVCIKFLLQQPLSRSIGISALINFISALCGAMIIFFFAFILSYPRIYLSLFFMGTLLIEYPFLFALLKPTVSVKRVFLIGLLMNIISHAGIIGALYLLMYAYSHL